MLSIRLTLLSLLVFVSLQVFAQPACTVKYQAVARDSENNVYPDRTIGVQFSILPGPAYIETHTTTTSSLGHFYLELGGGDPVQGNFEEIDWAETTYTLAVAVDLEGGTNYETLGESPILAVPVSIFSKVAGFAAIADSIINKPPFDVQLVGDGCGIQAELDYCGNLFVIPDADPINELITKFDLEGTVLSITEGFGDKEKTWIVDLSSLITGGGDLDPDPENEIQVLGKSGAEISLSRGGGTVTLNDDNRTNEIQELSKDDEKISLSRNGGEITLNDDDAENELQMLTKEGPVITLNKEGKSVMLEDDDPTNELQDLELMNDILILEGDESIDLSEYRSKWTMDDEGILIYRPEGILLPPTYEFDQDGNFIMQGFIGETVLSSLELTVFDENTSFSPGGLVINGNEVVELTGGKVNINADTIVAKVLCADSIKIKGEPLNISGTSSVWEQAINRIEYKPDNASGNLTYYFADDGSSGIEQETFFWDQSLSGIEISNGEEVKHPLTADINMDGIVTSADLDLLTTKEIIVFNEDNPNSVRSTTAINSGGFLEQTFQNPYLNTFGSVQTRPEGDGAGIDIINAGGDPTFTFASTSSGGVLGINDGSGDNQIILDGSGDGGEIIVSPFNSDNSVRIGPNRSDPIHGNIQIGRGSNPNDCLIDISGVTNNNYPNNAVGVISAGSFNVGPNKLVPLGNLTFDPIFGGSVIQVNYVFKDANMFIMDNPSKESDKIVYAAVEGPEAAAYDRGTSSLSQGEAFIPFSQHFKDVINHNTATVQITPRHWDTYGIAVVEVMENGFRVKELKGGTGDFEFDWEVKAVRKGFENYRILRGNDDFQYTKEEEYQLYLKSKEDK